jgi:uncharacterized protein YabE (DUF348 family)/3D (Asp-Asp-Asp) domain-containing protein
VAAGVLSFLVLPARKVTVQADGSQTEILSRTTDLDELLRLAGVERQANDVVVKTGAGIKVERAVPVTIEIDGAVLTWRTRTATVQALFDEVGLTVSPYDGITFNGIEVSAGQSIYPGPAATALAGSNLVSYHAEPATSGVHLIVERAVPFTIVEDGQTISFQSARPTIAMALRDAGIRLGPADEVYPSLTATLTAGQQVTVKHASAVTIRMGDSSRVIYTHQKILKDALAEVGLTLGAEDRVEPGIEAPVRNGMTARLVRVVGRTIIERDEVLYKTVFEPDESLQGSQTRVTPGSDGLLVREYRIVIEDGVETERTLMREALEPPPVNRVIYYAASSIRATGAQPESFQVQRVERMYATWYNAASSGRPATDPHYGITASGVPVTRGIVAVDPRVIPLGTRLYVPGYGFAIAGDTGGGIIGNMIDLGYPDGVTPDGPTGWLDVYILGP